MKKQISILSAFALTLVLFGFTFKGDIKDCCLSFTGAKVLTASPKEKQPETAVKTKTLQTAKGAAEVSVLESYKIAYSNLKKGVFVNLKVELSEHKQYGKDTAAVLDNLKYQIKHSKNIENSHLIEQNFNGSKIYGFRRNTIDKDSILGSFALFPGKNTIVYINFNNLKPEQRTVESTYDLRVQSNGFLGNYTSHLRRCLDK